MNKTAHNKYQISGEKERPLASTEEKGQKATGQGVTLNINMAKFYERIINERIKKEIAIRKDQEGGTNVLNCVHIPELQEVIKRKRNIYLTFLDISKAYDNARVDAIRCPP
jgi:hypothetical protein